ncbi:MAG: HAMP domain-containing sensor histidine kinase [Gemmatimonadota bacterium]|nr:HAMP domain-containing sensor histidine kinase [Gemmatimonadota bacterium]
MIRIRWPVALATLFLIVFGWYLVYTQLLQDGLRENQALMSEVFAIAQELIQDTSRSERLVGGRLQDVPLFDLQEVMIRSRIPMIIISPAESVVSVENLPFEADILTPEGQEEVQAYVSRIEANGQEPVRGAGGNLIYLGDPPQLSNLRWIPWLQASGLTLTALIGFLVIRYQRGAEQDKAWTAMARELAHQLGTPISSLKGWLELMGLPDDEIPEGVKSDTVAMGIERDLVRLERISHRFELIGRDPDLEILDIREVVRDLEQYLQARLPRLASEVLLVVDVPKDMPEILGSEVLLSWALENLVKNALDALAGRGGEIQLKVREGPYGWLHLRVHDTGPGVDPVWRDRIFHPGARGKARGWGVGLTLSRRIIEVTHKGHIFLLNSEGEGATFDIRLPTAQA